MTRVFSAGFILFILFGFGIYIGFKTDLQADAYIFILSCLILFGVIFSRINKVVSDLALIFSVVLAGCLWVTIRTEYFPANHIMHRVKPFSKVSLIAKVSEQYGKGRFICAACSVRTRVKTFPVTGYFLLVLPRESGFPLGDDNEDSLFVLHGSKGQEKLVYGDLILVSGKTEPIPSQSNYYVGDQRIRLFQREVRIQVRMDESDTLIILASGKGNKFFQSFILPLRERIVRAIESNLSGLYAGILKGIILGVKGDIPYEIKNNFSKAGISHILAVSGLHMGIIVALFFILFSVLFRGNYRIAVLPAIIASLIFTFLVGFQPSTVRAFVMSSFFLFSLLRGTGSNSFHTLGLAGFSLLVLNPTELFNPGFQLSFGAVWGILVLSPLINRLFSKMLEKTREKTRRLANPFYSLFSVSSSAQFGTAALVATLFYRVQVIGPIVNMIVVPAVSLALPAGIFSVVFFYIFKPLSKIFAAASWFFIFIILKTSEFASTLSWSAPFVRVPSLGLSFGYYLFLTFIADMFYKTKTSHISKWASLALFVLFIAYNFYTYIISKEIELVVFDTYKGSAFLVRRGNECIAFSSCSSDELQRIVIPYVNARGKTKPDKTIELTSPYEKEERCLTLGEMEINITKYAFVKIRYRKYEIDLVPEKEDKYLCRVEWMSLGTRFAFEFLPRGISKKAYGNSIELRFSGAGRIKFFDDKLEIETKRLGKIGEWRTYDTKRI